MHLRTTVAVAIIASAFLFGLNMAAFHVASVPADALAFFTL